MSEVILCNRNFSSSALKNECGIDIEQTSALTCSNPEVILANKPYLLKNAYYPHQVATLAKLSNPSTAKNLTDLSLSFGGDNLIALSTLSENLTGFNVGLMGASTSVYANRIGGFVGSVKDYQKALMGYRQASMAKSSNKAVAKQRAKMAFDKMQSKFRLEVKAVTNQVKSNRGTPMTNFKRGADIARSSRSVAKLNLINPVHADNIVKFTKHAKILGNGLTIIDFGGRVGNIHNSYKAGANWEKEMFIESTSFVASAATGIGVVNAGAAALTFLVVATPVGWVGLIVGGLAVAGTAAVASIGMNNAVKSNSGDWYDSILKGISDL